MNRRDAMKAAAGAMLGAVIPVGAMAASEPKAIGAMATGLKVNTVEFMRAFLRCTITMNEFRQMEAVEWDTVLAMEAVDA